MKARNHSRRQLLICICTVLATTAVSVSVFVLFKMGELIFLHNVIVCSLILNFVICSIGLILFSFETGLKHRGFPCELTLNYLLINHVYKVIWIGKLKSWAILENQKGNLRFFKITNVALTADMVVGKHVKVVKDGKRFDCVAFPPPTESSGLGEFNPDPEAKLPGLPDSPADMEVEPAENKSASDEPEAEPFADISAAAAELGHPDKPGPHSEPE